MLSREDNELLTRVGPGTPMGELFRRFWLPAFLPSELPSPDCDPVRIRLLGEDLVAFRDTMGRVGLLAEACSHRSASLYFGRNEECGLRCVYHGWKYDVEGRCVDMPNEPPDSTFKDKVRHPAYPTREWGGVIWAYLGPKDAIPELPQLEWALVPNSHRRVSKWMLEVNYAQALEGELDSSHVSFLHETFEEESALPKRQVRGDLWKKDRAPQLTVQETEYGGLYGSRRNAGNGQRFWRVTHWLLPTYALLPNPQFPRWCHAYVPIDDYRTWVFDFTFHRDRPLNDAEQALLQSGSWNTPRIVPGTFRTLVNKDNDFLLDRDMQRTQNFTGIWGILEQDIAIVHSMGPICDRTRERLVPADVAVITARRVLLRLAQQVQQGALVHAARHGELYRVRSLDVVDAHDDLPGLLDAHREALVAPPELDQASAG